MCLIGSRDLFRGLLIGSRDLFGDLFGGVGGGSRRGGRGGSRDLFGGGSEEVAGTYLDLGLLDFFLCLVVFLTLYFKLIHYCLAEHKQGVNLILSNNQLVFK